MLRGSMSSPYREGLTGAPLGPTDGDDLVSQVAQQFTDPMAFYRELVQNALDAGTTSIRVALSFTNEGGGLLEVRVRDDGCGMNREVLEEQLLVLFRSSKEGRSDAIGKFGIGFISVLAVKPSVVSVVTSTGDGVSYRASLYPDHTWEISESPGGEVSGSTVTLRLARERAEVDAFVEDSKNALRRWCEHSAQPIFFRATADGDVLVPEERIDSPLSVESVHSVSEMVGSTAMVVGLAGRGSLRAAFYNRGLLLREFRAGDVQDLIGSVRFNFAAQDPALEHTLSREDVRRDEAFARVVHSVTNVARRKLPQSALSELAELARKRPRGWQKKYGRLLFALDDSGLDFDAERLRVPCIDAQGEGIACTGEALLEAGEVFLADGVPEVQRLLLARGAMLIDPDACGHGAVPRRPWIALLTTRLKLTRIESAARLTSVVERFDAQQARLGESLVQALAGTKCKVRAVGFGELFGALGHALYVVCRLNASPATLETADKLSRWPRFRLRAPTLVLSKKHPLVLAALESRHPALAASCLARAILADAKFLDDDVELDLARRGIERALETP